ncbi:thioredoxin-dependent thiol peroxidase [Hufsiella ginkgonis]|uniref:thioredoxin-dependent peroxiredoxin n=1 Tax=Hufsiella ginkgonis TaxID=2695274 RepID=A0A7K1Y3E6_9SPHI|nr:thioredoxin-dependent thiol peroxidase [Hufsiella ginkgonis]MXV17805.1 thioredoxin-dependent thiol peroxidase [Hufsiella ginkgonis]
MPTPQQGDPAPDFTATDQHGNKVSLSDYRGKEVILYFYPQDNTPTCTVEACNFRDNYQSLQRKGFEVIGISPDNEKSHTRFITKHQLPFTLIADKDRKIVERYGLWVEKTTFGRTYMGTARKTFVIGKDGVIKLVIDKVTSKTASQQVLDLLGQANPE